MKTTNPGWLRGRPNRIIHEFKDLYRGTRLAAHRTTTGRNIAGRIGRWEAVAAVGGSPAFVIDGPDSAGDTEPSAAKRMA
ncbi:MAG: hypothetical protein Kow0026_12620 [Oricola sp.]